METAEIFEELTFTDLTQDYVNILTQKFALIDGVKAQVGENFRRSYRNTPDERVSITKFLPEPWLTAVFAVWGPEPTVFDDFDE